MFDETGAPLNGPLPTDRPHQFKAQLIYDFAFGTTVGVNGYVASGTPISRAAHFIPPNNFPVRYLGRGSDGRTPTFSQLDLRIQQEFRLGGRSRLQLVANVLNVLNQQTPVNRYPWQLEPGAGVSVTPEQFFRGVDSQALLAEQGLREDPRFLMDSEFQLPRELRVGIRFLF
jgi:outer membrane receptor for Fe3+-dicitrate